MRLLQRRRAGFTLIELLVVVAIVAILAAVLFPVFTRAKEAGRRSSCAMNLMQIHRAMLMYCNDWAGRLPWANAWYNIGAGPVGNTPSPPDARFVGQVLRPYENNKADLWKCPTSPYKLTDPHFWNWVGYYNLFSYSVAAAGTAPDATSLSGQPMERPDFTVNWMLDKNGQVKSWGATRQVKLPILWDQRKTHWDVANNRAATDKEYSLMHYDGWNVLFLDGHVKFYTEKDRSPYQPE